MSMRVFSLSFKEKIFGYFMQDGATAHTSFINVLNEVFEDRLAHYRLWPANFPVVNPRFLRKKT
jgi:hypothetical protein